nr:hypothetical protein CTI12_AA509060 [Tanacetum cinerariifolium]
MNTSHVRDNANVFQLFNSYAKAVLGNKSVGVSGKNDASNSGEKPVRVSVSNKENEESSNEALISMTNSLERKDDEGPSLDGRQEHEKPLDVDNYDSNTSIPEVVEDLSSLDKSSDKEERLAHHNNGLDDLDISLRNRLLHQDNCQVRPVAAVNDSSIVSLSTPPVTVQNLSEESCSTKSICRMHTPEYTVLIPVSNTMYSFNENAVSTVLKNKDWITFRRSIRRIHGVWIRRIDSPRRQTQ